MKGHAAIIGARFIVVIQIFFSAILEAYTNLQLSHLIKSLISKKMNQDIWENTCTDYACTEGMLILAWHKLVFLNNYGTVEVKYLFIIINNL